MKKPKRRAKKKVSAAIGVSQHKGVEREATELTVGELINQLRLRDPSTLVIVRGCRHFVAASHIDDFIVWKVDDDLFPGYTDDLTMGLPGSGRPAVFLDYGIAKTRR